MTGTEPSGKISWLWKQVDDAREAKDAERAREGLSRLLASQEIRGTPDQDLALLYLAQLEMEEGRVSDVARRLQGFMWHGIPGPAALLLASDIFLRLDWYERSLESMTDYLEHYPQDTDALRDPPVEGERVEKNPVIRIKYAVAVPVVHKNGSFRKRVFVAGAGAEYRSGTGKKAKTFNGMTRAAARRFQHCASHRHWTRLPNGYPGPRPSVERAFRPAPGQGPVM